MEVNDIDLNDTKYQYLFTVDNINTLVAQGLSFREAYQNIGKELQEGCYTPDTSKQHVQVGSMGNFCLDVIRGKFPT